MKEIFYLWIMSTINVQVQLPPEGFNSRAECETHLSRMVLSASHHVENQGIYAYRIWGSCVAVPQKEDAQ